MILHKSKHRFPTTTILQLLIASVAVVVALLGLCAGDVSHINHELPKDIVLPFNDLLPPPLDESTTAAPQAAVVATTSATSKPTKKSYYQQQAKSKDVQAAAEKSSSSKTPVPQLALDLLPPFAEPATSDALQAVADDRTHATSPATAISERSVPRVLKPHEAQARVSRPNSIASAASASSTSAVKTNALTPDLIAQYASHFQFTTPRPRRGPLPTLTPFPRYHKL